MLSGGGEGKKGTFFQIHCFFFLLIRKSKNLFYYVKTL